MYTRHEIEAKIFYHDDHRKVTIVFDESEEDLSVGYPGYLGIVEVFESGLEIVVTPELEEICLKAIETFAKDECYANLVSNYLY